MYKGQNLRRGDKLINAAEASHVRSRQRNPGVG